MKFIISLLLLVAVCNAAPQQAQQQFNYQNYLSSQTTTEKPPVYHPPASIHYVNIGQELNGDYKFGYDTGKGPSGQSFREETRLPDGSVKGQYGYLDAQNKMRIVKYTAGLNGFSIDSDTALNDQQIAASRPTAPNPQYQSPPAPQAEQPRQNLYSARQSFGQGLAQAAQQQYQQYLPAPTPQAQQPYTGYAPQQPAVQQAQPLPQYNANAYGSSAQQLTPAQLQQQALAAARARQAALARQQQQEAIIRQQQQAATEQILAQQRAALEAQQAAQQQDQASQKQQYQNLAAQYAAAQPAPQQAPQQQYAPQPAQAPVAPPTYQSPQYQPASSPSSYSSGSSRTTELKPDVLSQFIQLPGTRLIQIDKPRQARQSSGLSASLLSSNSAETNKNLDEEYTGPVVINAALLNYDIGTTKLPNGQQPANKRA